MIKTIKNFYLTLFLVVTTLAFAFPVQSQDPKHEMRGVWVTTVYGLDWPTQPAQSSAHQIAQLTSLFDDLANAGINAVFFQIRSEADAMYESLNEPWSRFLTGTMGAAPNPYYDPLALAIELAHERGMELHAWMNPFRAVSARGPFGVSSTHITKTRPDWILDVKYKGPDPDLKDEVISIFNPGILEVHDYIADVVRDVVSRYKVDGVHFDDYFYPYPSYEITVEDESYYNATPRGFLTLPDWRRDNINRFVATVAATIRSTNPGVKFGISPFGIWKSGVPQGIVGLSSYDVIYADPIAWLEAGTVDYLTPQLYWPFGGGQDFGLLADWWVSKSNNRHIYTGMAAYQTDAATFTGTRYTAAEIPSQIDFGRTTTGIEGSILFRANNLRPGSNNLGLTDALSNGYYAQKAFTPYMTYTDLSPPDAPQSLTAVQQTGGVLVRWDPPLTGFVQANKFGVYRVRSDTGVPNSQTMTNDPENLLAITWEPEFVDRSSLETGGHYYYAVTGVSPNSIEGIESNLADLVAVATGIEQLPHVTTLTATAYPNPSQSNVQVRLELNQPSVLQVSVFDGLGRVVQVLTNGNEVRTEGLLELAWNGQDSGGKKVSSGVYFIVIRTSSNQKTLPVTMY